MLYSDTLQVDFANAIRQKQNQLTQQRANGQEQVKCVQEKESATVEAVIVLKDIQDNVVKSKCQGFVPEKMTKHVQVLNKIMYFIIFSFFKRFFTL